MIARRFKVVSLIGLLLISGCTKKKEDHLELKVHFPKVNLRLDPHRMEDAYSMMIVSQLYRGLLRFNSDGDVVPDLALSWKESGDRKSYRFKLRPATFSNGEKVTAKNVQLTFARMFVLGAGMAADLDYIKGVKEFLKSKNLDDFGVKVIADDEVEFQLENASALFLKHMAVADCGIMDLHSLADVQGLPQAFSGPYQIEKQEGDQVYLTKWRKDPLESKAPPERILFFGTTEDAIALANAGKTDTLDRDVVPPGKRKDFEKKGWGTSPTELTGESFIVLNPKYLSEDLRRYLYLKVDPAAVVAQFSEPQFKPAYGLIPTGFPGELSNDDVAGMRKPEPQYKGKKVSFQFDYDSSADFDNQVVSYLKKVWPSDRIEVQFNPMTKAEKLSRMFSKTSQAVLGRKGIDYPDGFSVLTYFKGKYESNYFHVDDSAIDSEIGGAVKEFDAGKRTELYKKLQLQILGKYTTIPLLFGSQASGLWSGKVKMVPSHPMGYHTMPFETIEMRTD